MTALLIFPSFFPAQHIDGAYVTSVKTIVVKHIAEQGDALIPTHDQLLRIDQRALLVDRGVRVHAVLTGPTDTDMSRGVDISKASPESVARAIFDGVENGNEDIFPDPMSQSPAESWRNTAAKTLEHQYALLVTGELVKS
jgi:hypothetical protein